MSNELLRIRVWPFDFDGSKSDMSYVGYFKTEGDAKNVSWKYELA